MSLPLPLRKFCFYEVSCKRDGRADFQELRAAFISSAVSTSTHLYVIEVEHLSFLASFQEFSRLELNLLNNLFRVLAL